MYARARLDPGVGDETPTGPDFTPYHEQHCATYLRLLDASRDGANWAEVSRIVLRSDPNCAPVIAGKAISRGMAVEGAVIVGYWSKLFEMVADAYCRMRAVIWLQFQ